MIELRWLMDSRSDAHRVLQYREGGYDMIERATGKVIWCGSDWQDVPEVIPEPQSHRSSTKEQS